MESTAKESWRERCRRLYEERGLTQEKFSERLGISQSGLSKWIIGDREPSLADFEAMARVLTEANPDLPVTPSYLVWGPPTEADLLSAAIRVLRGNLRSWDGRERRVRQMPYVGPERRSARAKG